jgi:(3R)-3-hydroxyacyl-CoA dehydrogenase / 3a,7a,12a-trihydroxy-5b-cholest-24-enoyl-CoA hydratase / enoyl-CoA hydratase 2
LLLSLPGALSGGDKAARNAPADDVVAAIKHLGGNAVASYDSVLDGQKIIALAESAFGSVDVLVNNAGILRDKSFQKMTKEDWYGDMNT